MAKKKYTILFVEDTDFWVDSYKGQFEQKINFLHENTIIGAAKTFKEKAPEIDMIIVSGREDDFNTLLLITFMRAYYSLGLEEPTNEQDKKMLMATSASPEFRKKMMEAGCNLNIPKSEVEGYLRMMLKE